MAYTVLLCIMFPMITLLNSYCLGKVFSVYFKRYRVMEDHSLAIGFMAYVFIALASVFLFVFIPIQYQILIYLLIAVQGLLVLVYGWHWRAVFSFVWGGWWSALFFVALIFALYGLALLFGTITPGSQSAAIISSDSVQTDASNSIYRFQTWQKFLNCWVLITGGDYQTFVSYSVLFVLVVPCAAIVHRLVLNCERKRSQLAALLLLTAAFACGIWRFSILDFSAWMIPAAMLMFLEIRDYFDKNTGRSSMTVVILAALAGMSMSRSFFYVALCVIWGLVFAMGMKKDNTVGSHFYRTVSGSSLMLSMYLYDQSIPGAATLFFVGLAATITHVLLVSGGRDRHVLFIAKFFTSRARNFLLLLGFFATAIGLILALVYGFDRLSYGIYGPPFVLSYALTDFSLQAYWPVVGIVYGIFWVYCLFATLSKRPLQAGVWGFGGLVLANPLLVTMLAGLAGSGGLELSYFVPTAVVFGLLYRWCVSRRDWSGVLASVFVSAAALGLLSYEVHFWLPQVDWKDRSLMAERTKL